MTTLRIWFDGLLEHIIGEEQSPRPPGMNKGVALAGLSLAACAEPGVVEQINIAVNTDHPYSHYIRKLNAAHSLKAGEAGNCTDIAFTKKAELA